MILKTRVGHSTLKLVGVFGAKRRSLGLKNGFLAKMGTKEPGLKSSVQFFVRYKELKFGRKWGLGAAKF